MNEVNIFLTLEELTGSAEAENETPSRRCVPDSLMPGSYDTKRENTRYHQQGFAICNTIVT